MKRLFLVLVGIVLGSELVMAGERVVTTTVFERRGLVVGGNLGAQHISNGDLQNTGFATELYLGAALANWLSVLGFFNGQWSTENFGIKGSEASFTNIWAGPVIQLNLSNRFFTRAGAGYVLTRTGDVESSTGVHRIDRDGFGVLIEAGYEVAHLGPVAIDLNARYLPQWFSGSASNPVHGFGGGVGLTIY